MKIRSYLAFLVLLCPVFSTSMATPAQDVYKNSNRFVYTVFGHVDGPSQGSGVAINSDKYGSVIATNCHVVSGSREAKVTGSIHSGDAQVIYCSKDTDIAILTIKSKVPSLTLQPRTLNVGEAAFAIGSPKGLALSISEGVVSQIRRKTTSSSATIQTTAAIEPGSSGGGLFDRNSRLLGITSSKIAGSQGLNFAISLEEIQKAINIIDRKFRNLEPTPSTKEIYQRSEHSIRGFRVGQHCSEVIQVAQQLQSEGYFLAYGNEEPFCSEYWQQRSGWWVKAEKRNGEIYRKQSIQVVYDEFNYATEITFRDTWFYGFDVDYPTHKSLDEMIRVRYGDPELSGVLEDVGPAFLGPPIKSRSSMYIYANPDIPDRIEELLIAAKTPGEISSILNKSGVTYLSANIKEISYLKKPPHGLSLEIEMRYGESNRRTAPDMRPKSAAPVKF
jgi:Trypsin-like peptidase domain